MVVPFLIKGLVKFNGACTSVPISNPRFVLAAEAVIAFVPPLIMATLPVTLEAFPVISPVIFDASIPVAILALLTPPSFILAVVMALLAIIGAAADPVKSPANWILPLLLASASGILSLAICSST